MAKRIIPTPRTGRKRLVAARKRRDKSKPKSAALRAARADVKKAEKNLRLAHERKALCSTAYTVKHRRKRRR